MHGGSGPQSQHIISASIWLKTVDEHMFRLTGENLEKNVQKKHVGCQLHDVCCPASVDSDCLICCEQRRCIVVTIMRCVCLKRASDSTLVILYVIVL